MSKSSVYEIKVQFGDCDPAGIVFFPNFSKWMDAASLHFFMACGVPPWRELKKTTGIIGTPLLEIHTRFMRPATYGETLHVHTSIESWAAKTFVVHPEGEPDRIKAIPVPEDIKALCS